MLVNSIFSFSENAYKKALNTGSSNTHHCLVKGLTAGLSFISFVLFKQTCTNLYITVQRTFFISFTHKKNAKPNKTYLRVFEKHVY